MPGKDLKHYDKYFKIIEKFAKAINLKIERKSVAGDGAFIHSRSKIVIDQDLEQSSEIAVLLHELGHAIDLSRQDEFETAVYNLAYNAVYDDNLCTEKHLQEVLKWEISAWKTARGLASLLKIKLGEWFDEEERDGLDSYKKVDTKHQNS